MATRLYSLRSEYCCYTSAMLRIGLGITAFCLIVWLALSVGQSYVKRRTDLGLRAVEWPSLKDQWLDVNLPVREVKQISPGHFRVITQGVYDGEVLGLTFEFNGIDPNNAFLANPSEGKITATSNGVVIISQGTPTANFVRAYAKLANKSLSKLSVPDNLNFTAISLGGNPRDVDMAQSKIKVFHADDQAEGPFYFEAFINPDVPHGYIESHEKDPDYRDGILRSFGAQF